MSSVNCRPLFVFFIFHIFFQGISSVGFAQDKDSATEKPYAVVLGIFRQTSAQAISSDANGSPSGISNGSSINQVGFGLGIKTTSYRFFSDFYFHLGLMLEQRNAKVLVSGIEHQLEMQTLGIQTPLAYQITPQIAIFGGPQYSVLLQSHCRSDSVDCQLKNDAKKYYIPVLLGFDLNFSSRYSAEIFYELISQEIWEKTLDNSRSLGLNVKFHF